MRKIAPRVQKSIYPLDYNIENPMTGFNSWAQHIREETLKISSSYKNNMITIFQINIDEWLRLLELKDKFLENRIMDNLVLIANKIINNTKK